MAEWSKAVDLSSILRCRRGFKPHSKHFFSIIKKKEKKKTAPQVGFEPTTPGLEVRCAIHCATEAKNDPGGTRTHNR